MFAVITIFLCDADNGFAVVCKSDEIKLTLLMKEFLYLFTGVEIVFDDLFAITGDEILPAL